ADDQFKGTGEPTTVRDAYGVGSDGAGWGLAVGGVIVCLPEAGGTLYRGDVDHRDRWCGQPHRITDARIPSHHVGRNGFFLGRNSSNKRTCGKDGEMYILAWDEAFADNAGFYEVHVRLTQAPPPPPFDGEIKRGQDGSRSKSDSKKT